MKIKKLIDCSQTFFHNNPGYLPYELCEINYETLIAKDGYQSERMYMNTHTSTHFDAPRHHFIDGMDAAEYPIENLVGEAVPMDFLISSPVRSPMYSLWTFRMYLTMASSNLSPATLMELLVIRPPSAMTAISVVPPPISMTIFPSGSVTSRPAPMAAARGSSIRYTSCV